MTKGSGDARMQLLYFLITTAGNDTNSICYETHQKAKDILEGRKIDKTFYPVIYGAGEEEDWIDPKVWLKSNPSLGETIGLDKVQAACDSARQNPGEENSFRQLRLNQWVKQAVRWMPMEKWDLCATPVNVRRSCVLWRLGPFFDYGPLEHRLLCQVRYPAVWTRPENQSHFMRMVSSIM